MSGIAVIRALLVAHAPLLLIVPGDRIGADDAPLETDIPAIVLEDISNVDWKRLTKGTTRHVTERISVIALAHDVPSLKQILDLCKNAAAEFVGTIADVADVTVQSAGRGPRMRDPITSIRSQNQDFLVGFTEPT